jgi:hypothetical protein
MQVVVHGNAGHDMAKLAMANVPTGATMLSEIQELTSQPGRVIADRIYYTQQIGAEIMLLSKKKQFGKIHAMLTSSKEWKGLTIGFKTACNVDKLYKSHFVGNVPNGNNP